MMTIGGVEWKKSYTRSIGGCSVWVCHVDGRPRALLADGTQWRAISEYRGEVFEGISDGPHEAVAKMLKKQVEYLNDEIKRTGRAVLWLFLLAVSLSVIGYLLCGVAEW